MNKKIITKILPALGVIMLFLVGFVINLQPKESADIQSVAMMPEIENAPPTPTIKEVTYEIASGDTFKNILEAEAGIPHNEALDITEKVSEVYDITKIQAGSIMKFFFAKEAFAQTTYDIDNKTTLVIKRDGDDIKVSEEEIEYEVRQNQVDATIDSSLYVTGTSEGMSGKAIIELANIFAWDIDFTTNIQKGDSFSVVYENRYRDGEFAGIGDILAARFTNEGEDFYAFMVENEGEKKYYNEEGFSKELALLKTPLNYSRVSSQFSFKRKNPVTGDVGSHRAVDLAAPQGTPIESVGDGTVEYADWNGGYGKYIKIRHGNGFVSAYAHLSSIDSKIKKGARVTQGQLIGRVGSTGRSTGPHLHYEVYENGNPVDPFNLDISPSEEISEELVSVFEAVKSKYKTKIES